MSTTPAPPTTLDQGIIIGISICGAAILLVLIFTVYRCRRKKANERRNQLVSNNTKARQKSGHANAGFEEVDETKPKAKRSEVNNIGKQIPNSQNRPGQSDQPEEKAKSSKPMQAKSVPKVNGIDKDTKQKTSRPLESGTESNNNNGVLSPTATVEIVDQKSIAEDGIGQENKNGPLVDLQKTKVENGTVPQEEKSEDISKDRQLESKDKSSYSSEAISQKQQNGLQEYDSKQESSDTNLEKPPANVVNGPSLPCKSSNLDFEADKSTESEHMQNTSKSAEAADNKTEQKPGEEAAVDASPENRPDSTHEILPGTGSGGKDYDKQTTSSENDTDDVEEPKSSKTTASLDVPSGSKDKTWMIGQCKKVQDADTGEITCAKQKSEATNDNREKGEKSTSEENGVKSNALNGDDVFDQQEKEKEKMPEKPETGGIKMEPSNDGVSDQTATEVLQQEQKVGKHDIRDDGEKNGSLIVVIPEQDGTERQTEDHKPESSVTGDKSVKNVPSSDNIPDQQEPRNQQKQEEIEAVVKKLKSKPASDKKGIEIPMKEEKSDNKATMQDNTENPDEKRAQARVMLEELQKKKLEAIKHIPKPVPPASTPKPPAGANKSPANTAIQPANDIVRYTPPQKKVHEGWPPQRASLDPNEGAARFNMEVELHRRLKSPEGVGLKSSPGVNRHKGPVKRKSYGGAQN